MKKLIIPAVVVIFVAIAVGAVFFGRKGTLTVDVNSLSPVKDGVQVYIANKKYPKPFTPPFQLQLRPGKYQLIALAKGANELTQDFSIADNKTTTISLTLLQDTSLVDQQEITPTTEELASNPFLKLFPHSDTDFKATAEFARDKDGKIYIQKITITPYLPIPASSNFNLQDVLKAKDAYVKEAKDWLKANNVPDNTPISIDSVF